MSFIQNRFMRRVATGAAVFAVAATALTACASTPADSGTAEAPADGELISITVGATPSIFSLAMHLGVNEGIFEAAGFDVTIKPNQSMSEGIPLLLQGDFQYIGGDMQNTILAASEGLPIVIAGPNTVTATEVADDMVSYSGLLTMSTSDMESIEDIAGKTVATNTIGGDAYMNYLQLAEEAGVDTSTINWVEIPGPQQVPSLRQGQVDAITIGEPNLTNALLAGDTKVVASADAVMNGAPQFGWVASQEWVVQNADAAQRFEAAIIEANELVLADRPAAEQALASYTELTPEVIAAVYMPYFSSEPITAKSLQSTVDRMVKFDLISESDVPDLDALTPKL